MKFQNNLKYYLLVAAIGILSSLTTVGFYILYLNIWSITSTVVAYSSWFIFIFIFLALAVSFGLVKLFAKTKSTGSGTHYVLETYHLRNGETSLRDTLVKPLAAIFTLGFGGSAGPEGPSLLIGGGIAANISKKLDIRIHRLRRIFVAGAAAGLTAVFRTPLTGILFALEIPYRNDLDMETFIEASIATIPSYLISVLILGSEQFFGSVNGGQLTLDAIGLSLLLGVICGLYAMFFTKLFSFVEKWREGLRRIIGNIGLIIVGALIVGAIGYFSMYSIGVGINFVEDIIKGTSLSIIMVFAIVLLKTVATTVTLNFGGSGGLFFPAIIVGAGIGYAFAIATGTSFQILFVAVGMAALLAGTHKIVLTPTAFVVETLGGIYAIPALIASGISYLVSGKNSFYGLQPRRRLKTEELAVEKFFLKAKKSIPNELIHTTASEFMTCTPFSIHEGGTIKDALESFGKTRVRVLPIVNDRNHVIGTVTLEDLGNIESKNANKTLSELFMHQPLIAVEQTSLEAIAEMMMEKDDDHVFVTNTEGELVGVISGIDVVRKITNLSINAKKAN
jgi:CIC family chloride channel protein